MNDSRTEINIFNIYAIYFLNIGTSFGKLESGYRGLENYDYLYQESTLFCVRERVNTSVLIWEHVDLAGVRTNITDRSIMYESIGLSIIQVYTDMPGFYSCTASQDNGTVMEEYSVYFAHPSAFPGG